MNRQEFVCPELTRLSRTESVASALGESANKLPSHRLGQFVLRVDSDGTAVRWLTAEGGLEFERRRVKSIALSNVEANGEKFVSFDVSFMVNKEQVTYGLITSHEADSLWLEEAAQKISRILGCPIS